MPPTCGVSSSAAKPASARRRCGEPRSTSCVTAATASSSPGPGRRSCRARWWVSVTSSPTSSVTPRCSRPTPTRSTAVGRSSACSVSWLPAARSRWRSTTCSGSTRCPRERLRYALRRMAHDRLAVIATQRTVVGDSLTTVTPPEQTLEIVLSGLDDAGIRQLVAPVMATPVAPEAGVDLGAVGGEPDVRPRVGTQPDERSHVAGSQPLVAQRRVDSPRGRHAGRRATCCEPSPRSVPRVRSCSPGVSPATDTATTLADAVERHLLTHRRVDGGPLRPPTARLRGAGGHGAGGPSRPPRPPRRAW